MSRLLSLLLGLLVSSSVLTGCRTHSESVRTTDHSLTQQSLRTDSTLRAEHRVDSVYRHDSTMVYIASRHDTVFVVKEFHHNYYKRESRDRREEKKTAEDTQKEVTDSVATELHEVVVSPPSLRDCLKEAALYASLVAGGCLLFIIIKNRKE